MSCKTGFDGKVYYNDTATTYTAGAGTYAVPVWAEIPYVKDLSISSATDKLEDTDRGSTVKKYCSGQMDLECTMNLSYRAGTDEMRVLRDAHMDRETLEVAIMDGAIATSGSEGFRFHSKVFSHDWDQPMQDVMGIDVTLAPTYYADGGTEIEPTWYIVP